MNERQRKRRNARKPYGVAMGEAVVSQHTSIWAAKDEMRGRPGHRLVWWLTDEQRWTDDPKEAGYNG